MFANVIGMSVFSEPTMLLITSSERAPICTSAIEAGGRGGGGGIELRVCAGAHESMSSPIKLFTRVCVGERSGKIIDLFWLEGDSIVWYRLSVSDLIDEEKSIFDNPFNSLSKYAPLLTLTFEFVTFLSLKLLVFGSFMFVLKISSCSTVKYCALIVCNSFLSITMSFRSEDKSTESKSNSGNLSRPQILEIGQVPLF